MLTWKVSPKISVHRRVYGCMNFKNVLCSQSVFSLDRNLYGSVTLHRIAVYLDISTLEGDLTNT